MLEYKYDTQLLIEGTDLDEDRISDCNRMSLMIRRAPSAGWLSEKWQVEMAKIDECVDCRQCVSKCPYELDIPNLLRKNLEDYRSVLAGKIKVTD